MTARRKTRLVVRSGSTGIGCDDGSGEGREREKRRAGGANSERVPVPVLCPELAYDGCSRKIGTAKFTCPDGARRFREYSGSGQGIGAPHALEIDFSRWIKCFFLYLSL